MVRKGGRMTPIQIQMLVDILFENSEIASGKISSSFSREERNSKWEAVATLLNSKGLGPQKTAEQWKKSWTDLKCTIRSKAAKIELAGGTNLLNEKLTNLEKRVLQLSGDITAVETPEGSENTKLTGKLWMKKLEDDLIKTEADLMKIMKKPNQIILPYSFSKLVDIPKEVPDKMPIVENIGVKKKTDEKDDNEKDDNSKDNDYMNLNSDDSDDDIIYDNSDVNEETFDNSVRESLSPPAKRRRVSSGDKTLAASLETKSFISVFQKQIETQTAVLNEQTNIMKDIAKSLRLIASALHDR